MLAVDLFAGWGGFTLGAEQAGAEVVWAANHWPLAVRAHAHNHPRTHHVCQDLRQADWTLLPEYDLMLAGPSCRPHSNASQPRRHTKRAHDAHNALRPTPWAVVSCAESTMPRALAVENVPQFQRWKLYPRWRQCLEDLGYTLTEVRITASHHGVPQRRTRTFVVGLRGRRAFTFQRPLAPVEPAFGPCIEWGEGKWRPFSAADGAARARFEAASRKYRRALVQHVSESTRAKAATGLPLDEPIRTITTKDQWHVIDGRRYRPLLIRENARGMGFPEDYSWPADAGRRATITGLGNAVCPPVGRELVSQIIEAA